MCLFVESAWRGNNGGWQNLIVGYEGGPTTIRCANCWNTAAQMGFRRYSGTRKTRRISTTFLGAAKEFDLRLHFGCGLRSAIQGGARARPSVCPAFRGCASDTQSVPGERVGQTIRCALPGVGCRVGTPSEPRRSSCCWTPPFPKACTFFDRNLTRPEYGPDYRFPDQYKEAIKGTLTYEEMLTAYRCYDVMLNVNTIADSPTMFARRVFESLACGTPVISSESVGMTRMLEGHVRVTRSLEETKKHLQELMGDEEARVREGPLGLPTHT